MENIRLYLKLIKISMHGRMQYRADFISGIVSVLVLNAVNLGLIGIMVQRFVSLNGWGIWDLVFLYCLWMLGHSIYSLFFWHLNTLEEYIEKGTFDQFLIRPVSPLVQFLGREIQYYGIGDVLVGLCGISLAYANLGLHWGMGEWAFLALSILSGTVIELAINWGIACISFWTVRTTSLFFIQRRLNLLVQQYPIDIFGTWFRVVVTGLVPMAFMNYYPSLVLLQKMSLISPGWLAYLSPANRLCSAFHCRQVVVSGAQALFQHRQLITHPSHGSPRRKPGIPDQFVYQRLYRGDFIHPPGVAAHENDSIVHVALHGVYQRV